MDLKVKNSSPTALCSSSSGNLAFIAYTDDSLRMIDVRSPDSEIILKTGGHTGMVKTIYVSQDESLLFTGGSDGTVRLWDIGMHSVVATFGQSKQSRGNFSSMGFHSDTINTMISADNNRGLNILSGSRDGSICHLDILSQRSSKVF